MIYYFRWAKPYIQESRGISITIWCEIDPFIRKWKDRLDNIEIKIISPGKRPL